jgi:hypothetical protein
VAIEVVSTVLRLEDLEARLGCPGGVGSRSRGDRHGSRTLDKSVWRFEAGDPGTDLDASLERLFKEWTEARVPPLAGLGSEARSFLTVGVIFYGPYASVAVDRRWIQICDELGLDLEVTAYPGTSIDEG